MSLAARLTGYAATSTSLALQSGQRLRELVDQAQPIGAGIGGTTVLLDVDGTPVFAKQVPLTDLERLPANVMSTANVFELPTFYQYGINSAGFGVWRELAVHTMTTNWVLGNQCENFPLMYHWRVLPQAPLTMPEELADTERVVEYWEGSQAVRKRLGELEQSSACVVVFLEYIPQNLHDWLHLRIAEGGESAESACAMVECGLKDGAAFMNSHGLLHFDAHFENILTDGEQLYFTDFGLSISDRFELAPDESDFLREHASYDRCYSVTHLATWLTVDLYGYAREERAAFLADCAAGKAPTGIPEPIAAIIMRYAPIAAVMNEFYRQLQRGRRTAAYPLDQIRRACAQTDVTWETRLERGLPMAMLPE
jgi:hypothetical protein